MLTVPPLAYAYQQYADDDDVQGFVAAYNQAVQAYLTWFNTASLPYYPALSGALLDWVAAGLYGMERTTLESQATAALGPLNTLQLNAQVLNYFLPSSTTYYSTTDDFFQRILTWHFYKADGKRFTMQWFKRRIMRFLAGSNGTDPNPADPGFVIGAEDTSAVSVTVASHVITVTLNQALLSAKLAITPGTLTLFQLALQGGVLEIPLQYTSATVTIDTTLTVSII
jgi:hypothetical protein